MSSDCQDLLRFIEANSQPQCPICHWAPVPPSLSCPRCGFTSEGNSPELLWCTRSLERDGLPAPVIARAAAIAFLVPQAQRELLVSLWSRMNATTTPAARDLGAFLKVAPELDPERRHQLQYRHATGRATKGGHQS